MEVIKDEVEMEEINNEAECDKNYKSHVFCDKGNCEFDLGSIAAIDAVFKISMDGGYVQYDGNGGLNTECPQCHCDSIRFET